MRTWFSEYALEPVNIKKGVQYSNKGILLKYEDGTYSLYHPVESLGDVSVKDFLKMMETESELTKKVKAYAVKKDDFISYLSFSKIRSYYSAPNFKTVFEKSFELKSYGFDNVKIKVSSINEIKENLKALEKTPFNFIFDFNGGEKKESFESLDEDLFSFFKNRVLYLEDPSRKAPQIEGVKIASDFIDYEDESFLRIVKPTGFNHTLSLNENSKPVVTSYLDHPLGQMIAALWAVKNEINLDCGLHSHTYYSLNEYSSLFTKKAVFDFSIVPQFFETLEKENWILIGK